MLLILQFAVQFVVGQVFAGLSRRALLSTATRFGASTTGFGAQARTALAGELIGNSIASYLVGDLAPRMTDRSNWSREAAEATAREILETSRSVYMAGPRPSRLQSRTGDSARRLRLEQRSSTVAVGSPDFFMLRFEQRDDTKRWRGRAWLAPSVADVLGRSPDAWLDRWHEETA